MVWRRGANATRGSSAAVKATGSRIVGAALLAMMVANAAIAESSARGDASFTRQVKFKLTYANCDLIWHGDPASPGALVCVPPGVEPIATDCHVVTLATRGDSPARRYLHEARIAHEADARVVYAFTRLREKIVGTIDGAGHFVPNDFFVQQRELLPTWPGDVSRLSYDAEENALYYEVDLPGPVLTESLDFLPLHLVDTGGSTVTGRFAIDYATPDRSTRATDKDPLVTLRLEHEGRSARLASATVPRTIRREEVRLGSFDNAAGTYLPEAVYRPGAKGHENARPSVTIELVGEFTSSVRIDGESLVLLDTLPQPKRSDERPAPIAIDGNFDDWRNVPGVSDPRGNVVPYLEYVPDVDLLEFKVSHDGEHLYLYARVAGRVGWTHPDGGRSYFYAYIDVDQDAGTGFLPTRDDECYYGVTIGDDCEVQFEFVDNKFRKTFYGFCGLGGDEDVLKQALTLGKSQYGRFDERGIERAHYKSEYIYRDGVAEITEDLKHGTSDTIRLAVSPDGSEVEIASTFSGFLKDRHGKPILGIGQTIDVAAGMECDSKAYPGKTRWAADSTPPIRNYHLRPIPRKE